MNYQGLPKLVTILYQKTLIVLVLLGWLRERTRLLSYCLCSVGGELFVLYGFESFSQVVHKLVGNSD